MPIKGPHQRPWWVQTAPGDMSNRPINCPVTVAGRADPLLRFDDTQQFSRASAPLAKEEAVS